MQLKTDDKRLSKSLVMKSQSLKNWYLVNKIVFNARLRLLRVTPTLMPKC